MKAVCVCAMLSIAQPVAVLASDCKNPRGFKLEDDELERVLKEHLAWVKRVGWLAQSWTDVDRLAQDGRAKLCNANLAGRDLSKANLAGADLRDAILKGANLEGASLAASKLEKADLKGANLKLAWLSGAHMVSTKLAKADLSGAVLRQAVLNSANLNGAKLDSTPDNESAVRLANARAGFEAARNAHVWALERLKSAVSVQQRSAIEGRINSRRQAWEAIVLYLDVLIVVQTRRASEEASSAFDRFTRSVESLADDLGRKELPIIGYVLEEVVPFLDGGAEDGPRESLTKALAGAERLAFAIFKFLAAEGKALLEDPRLKLDDLDSVGNYHVYFLQTYSKFAFAQEAELHGFRAQVGRALDAPEPRRPADLWQVTAEGADFTGASLKGAFLREANLAGANLSRARFDGATLEGADLSKARVYETDFTGVALDQAKLEYVVFVGAKGLSDIRVTDPVKVAELRQIARRTGLRQEDRALTSALRKFSLEYDTAASRLTQGWILGGVLTDYGARPSASLLALVAIIFVFWPVYVCALLLGGRRDGSKSGIYRVWNSDRVVVLSDEPPSERQQLDLPRSLATALYFSLLSAFQLGWREFNVGNWIRRLHPGEYDLRPVGWVKVVSGVQSLVCVYLLALWALTYFGRPFE